MPIETEDVVARLRTSIEEHRAHLAQIAEEYGGPPPSDYCAGIVVNFGDLIELVSRDQSLSERIDVLEGELEAARPKYAQSCFDHEYITPGCPDCGKMA